MRFSHLAGIFSCRWRTIESRSKRSKKATGADTSLDSSGGANNESIELEIDVFPSVDCGVNGTP